MVRSGPSNFARIASSFCQHFSSAASSAAVSVGGAARCIDTAVGAAGLIIDGGGAYVGAGDVFGTAAYAAGLAGSLLNCAVPPALGTAAV